jgi:hypothetical protein
LQAGIGGLQLAVFQDQGAVYMQEIPQSVVEALEGRTQAILGIKAVKKNTTAPNGSKSISEGTVSA